MLEEEASLVGCENCKPVFAHSGLSLSLSFSVIRPAISCSDPPLPEVVAARRKGGAGLRD